MVKVTIFLQCIERELENKARECEGCFVEEDSGHSPFCADKPKFGGH